MDGDDANLARAAEILQAANHIVVFSGAGVSAESGIPTFRDPDGLWQHFPPEQFATRQGLQAVAVNNPRRVAEFVLALLEPIAAAEPNQGHRAIAAMEQHRQVTVITQNIDGLHQAAGSTRVWEVHGSTFDIITMEGDPVARVSREELRQVVAGLKKAIHPVFDQDAALQAVQPILSFRSGSLVRPSIVLFGEGMAEPAWGRACEAANSCDCMLMVGTSGVVYPAAMLPEQAKAGGAEVIAVGPERFALSDVWLRGTSAGVLPALARAAFN
jgi:NAD-dependent deacetylase